jgi:NAD(P)-dependent dehydrogenase (short-subunit alcohol dehydrogenase family)
MDKQHIVWVTGASRGIGYAIASHLAETGYQVVACARTLPRNLPPSVWPVELDVTNENAVKSTCDEILERYGRIDALVNAAGVGMIGSVEDTSDVEARTVFDTNFFGVLNVCRHVAPVMRRQGHGRIINITSLAAQMALPFRGVYCASKFAVEGFSESLSQELRGDGIYVVIVEPGDVQTEINHHRLIAAVVRPDLKDAHNRIHRQVNQEVDGGMDPRHLARQVRFILESKNPRLRYRIAPAMAQWAYSLMRLLPDRLFERLIMRHYGLKQ